MFKVPKIGAPVTPTRRGKGLAKYRKEAFKKTAEYAKISEMRDTEQHIGEWAHVSASMYRELPRQKRIEYEHAAQAKRPPLSEAERLK